MKKRFIIFAGIFVVVVSCKKEKYNIWNTKNNLPNYGNVDLKHIFTKGETQLKNKDSIVEALQDYYQNVWENGNLSGGFLVAKGDSIIFEKYRGFGKEKNQMPIEKNTPLHVASVSKTMTAMAVLKLIEAEKMKLDDPITKYFPKFPYPKVTVFTLLTQRSGLPKYEYFIEKIDPEPEELSKRFLTNQDILNLLIRYKPDLARETNTGFMYCNTNFALLALLIEKVTKTPFPEAMQEILFRPLKMEHTFIFQEKDTMNVAQSFYYNGNRAFPFEKIDAVYGDKNVYTTPRDLLHFSEALFAKNFLKADLYSKIFEPYSNEKSGINNYGFGFRMKIFDNGEKLTYHNGWWHGSNAVFVHLLKSKVTIIAIGNKYSRRLYSALSLSGLFENFPEEKESLEQMNAEKDTLKNSYEE
jgi:CubicO group peptidase (beta-lactamase class C family)